MLPLDRRPCNAYSQPMAMSSLNRPVREVEGQQQKLCQRVVQLHQKC